MNRKSILILAVVFGLLTAAGIAYQIMTKNLLTKVKCF